MLNEKGLGNLEFPSPEIYNTSEKSSSQEAIFTRRVASHLARVVGSLGLFVSTLVSPLDSPTKVNAQERELQQNTARLTLLHGNGSKDRLNILLLPYNGATTAMLQEVAEDLFFVPPLNEFRDDVNGYTTSNNEDLRCNQSGDCDWEAVNRETHRVLVTTNVIPHRTLVVIKSNDGNGNGRGFIANRNEIPNIYTPLSIVRPENPGSFRKLFAGGVAHELAHTFGINHGGEDIMDHGSTCNCFNEQHTRELREIKRLIPYNFIVPKNELRALNAATILADQVAQTADMSLAAVIYTPIGTTQLYSEIVPFNNDGPGIFEINGVDWQIHALSEIGRKIPAPKIGEGNYILLPDMTYTWRVKSSGLSVPLVANDPRWESVEGWPGVFFPNPGAELKFRTPKRFSDGITAVSPQVGEAVTQSTEGVRLQWRDINRDVFYFEVQASKDCSFNTSPDTAIASVYHNLIHGGVTNPENSWLMPANLLEVNTEYCWRIRPRVQGDGTPVAWGNTFRFRTS